MSYRLRPAVESDKPFLYQLHRVTMSRHIEETWGWDENWQRNDFQQRFSRYAVSVIEMNRMPIGGLWLEELPATLYIADIQVLPEWQRQGIGTRVLRDIIAQAEATQRELELAVLPVNVDARRLYERIGFKVTRLEAPFVYMRYHRAT